MAPSIDDNDEKPLDPVVERVRRRVSRLILIAGLTLGLGIFAVFGAILYKIVAAGDKAPAAAWRPGEAVPTLGRAEMGLPADARLIATALDGRRVVLTYAHGAGNALVFIDADTLRVTGRLDLAGE